jgi:hypothetical protein
MSPTDMLLTVTIVWVFLSAVAKACDIVKK